MPKTHPTGPNIHKGKCPPGMIFDSEGSRRCISLASYRKKYGKAPRTASRKKKSSTRRA